MTSRNFGIDGAAASSTARAAASACTQNPTRKTGSIQPRRNPHAIDVRIRTVVQQQPRNFNIVIDQGAQQRRRARTEERICKTASTTGFRAALRSVPYSD